MAVDPKEALYRAAVACRIANLDRQRLTEAIRIGNYPCAPPTEQGAARRFDFQDLVCLVAYSALLRWHEPRVAGWIACELRQVLSQAPEVNEVALTFEPNGNFDAALIDASPERLRQTNPAPFHVSGQVAGNIRFPIGHRLHINVDVYRQTAIERARKEIERDSRTIGAAIDDGAE